MRFEHTPGCSRTGEGNDILGLDTIEYAPRRAAIAMAAVRPKLSTGTPAVWAAGQTNWREPRPLLIWPVAPLTAGIQLKIKG